MRQVRNDSVISHQIRKGRQRDDDQLITLMETEKKL